VNLGIEGRIALVTGSSKNIGLAIAKELANQGARVILTGRKMSELQLALDTLCGEKARHLCVEVDFLLPGALDQLKYKIGGAFSEPEIIVHNLGGSLGVQDLFAASEDWSKVWNFNLGIAHDINRNFVPIMQSKKWGRVLHLSTLSTETYTGNPAYVSAKCALNGYVKAFSRAVAKDNVLVNALAPGLIDIEGRYFSNLQKTDPDSIMSYYANHLPIARMGTCSEIGKMATILCSDVVGYVSGSIIRVDGGGH
jgi:3-oxoacyl-[acyl-carrier protein] reductase